MEKGKDVFCGSGKTLGDWGIKVFLNTKNAVIDEKGYCKLILKRRREPDKMGNDWSLCVDSWKRPEGQAPYTPAQAQPDTSNQPKQPDAINAGQTEDDLPF